MRKPILNLKRALVGNPVADLSLTQMKPAEDRTTTLHDPPVPKSNPQDRDGMKDAEYDSDAPISTWAGKRALRTITNYHGAVTFHVHIHQGTSKKPRTTTEQQETAEYLRAIAGK